MTKLEGGWLASCLPGRTGNSRNGSYQACSRRVRARAGHGGAGELQNTSMALTQMKFPCVVLSTWVCGSQEPSKISVDLPTGCT